MHQSFPLTIVTYTLQIQTNVDHVDIKSPDTTGPKQVCRAIAP